MGCLSAAPDCSAAVKSLLSSPYSETWGLFRTSGRAECQHPAVSNVHWAAPYIEWPLQRSGSACGTAITGSLLCSGQMPCYMPPAWQPSQPAGLFSRADIVVTNI